MIPFLSSYITHLASVGQERTPIFYLALFSIRSRPIHISISSRAPKSRLVRNRPVLVVRSHLSDSLSSAHHRPEKHHQVNQNGYAISKRRNGAGPDVPPARGGLQLCDRAGRTRPSRVSRCKSAFRLWFECPVPRSPSDRLANRTVCLICSFFLS